MKTLFIFPGQGAQYAGIGSDLFAHSDLVKETYAQANDVLGFDVQQLSFTDPDNKINLTRYTQPVLLTHQVACLRAFREQNSINADYYAGHSLGEYTALVAADWLSFEDALLSVKRRGELMSEYGTGEMTAFSMDMDTLQAYADQFYCGIAGCNLPDQTVVGGSSEDLEKLEAAMSEAFPRKRFTRLKTEGAFHTYYMVQAAILFREHLNSVTFTPNETKVASNFTGGFHDPDPQAIRSKLFYQLFHPVMWHKNLMTIHGEGLDQVFEFGGGIGTGETPAEKRPNLEGMIKKAFRHEEHKPEYKAIINVEGLTS